MKWAQLGGERGFLGFPLTDELGTPDGIGRFNHFEGGSIYWTPETGAHEVHGAIRDAWQRLGWETSFLPYPTSDEQTPPNGHGRFSEFQGGSIHWTPEGGTEVRQRIDHSSCREQRDPALMNGGGIAERLRLRMMRHDPDCPLALIERLANAADFHLELGKRH